MPAIPRLLGDRYRLLNVVARGGMGQVWEASDELLGRTVAIKEVRFPTDVPEEERAVMGERTMREAKLTARLAHRGIITIYDVICVDDRPFIVMELVRAPSLARQVDERGPLPPAEVADIGLQLLDALSVAHRQGIVHRDVKPSNVLLAPNRVVLTDFGIATSESDATLTSTGLLIGSPTYMSPERLRGEGIGPPADMWSLGATLYAALEGQPPFRATTTMGTITAVLVDSPHPLHISGPLGEAVLGLLDKDVASRLTGPKAAELLRESLEQQSGPLPSSPAVSVPPTPAELPPVMAPVVTWQNPIHLDEDQIDDLADSSARGPSSSFSFVAAAPGYDHPGFVESGLEQGEEDWVGDDEDEPHRRRVGLLAGFTVLVAAALVALLVAWTQLGDSGQVPTANDTTKSSGSGQHRGNGGGTSVHSQPTTSTVTTKTKSPPKTAATSPTTSTPTAPTSAPATTTALTTAPTTTPTTVPPTTPITTPPTTVPPTTPITTPPPPVVGAAVPAGYTLMHDPLGFQVAVPRGWYRRSSGSTYADYVSPSNSANYLRIDQKAQAGPSALGAWQEYEPSVKASHPGYQRIRLASVPFRQWEAADLEFTWQGSNGAIHVLDRGFITDPRGFALLMQGPDSTWQSQSLPVFQVAAATFSPTA